MFILTADDPNFDVLRLVVEHVFMPPKLPQKHPGEQIERKMNVALCDNLIGAAEDFLQDIPPSQHPLWKHMIKMMGLARRAAEFPFDEAELRREFSDMAIGGMSIYLAPFYATNQTSLDQTYFLCIFAHRTLLSLCADFPPAISFNSRYSKSRHRIRT
jgi:hypothetical protein